MNKQNPRFPQIPIYLINLDRSTDRLDRMRALLSAASLAFERVPAVDGAKLAEPLPEYDDAAFRIRHGKRRNPGEVGCYLSHIECARRLLASDSEYALVLEDDISVPHDIHEIIKEAIDAGRDWDILRLSTVNSGRKFVFRKMSSDRGLAICLTREKGSGAYLINRRAARWFLEDLVPMRLPFDIAFDLEYLSGLKAAFVSPPPIDQDTGHPSQIQKGRRALRLSRWSYATVMPYRISLEASRLVCRARRLVYLLVRQAIEVTLEQVSERRLTSARYLKDMAVPQDQATRKRGRRHGRLA